MSFNLRQDLKIYTSERYTAAKHVASFGRIVGDRMLFTAHVKLVPIKDSYGGSSHHFEVTPEGLSAERFAEFLNKVGGSNLLYGTRHYVEWAEANPTKTYNDFIAGTVCDVSLSREPIDTFISSTLPANRMNALVFDKESKLAWLLGKVGQFRSRLATWRCNATFFSWALYGIEIPASSTRPEIQTAVGPLVPKDFGISSCDDMEVLLKQLERVNAINLESCLLALKLIDQAIAKAGGAPITRKRPRQALLRAAYYHHTGETPPAIKPTKAKLSETA